MALKKAKVRDVFGIDLIPPLTYIERQLVDAVFSKNLLGQRVIHVFGPSGCGKTSLYLHGLQKRQHLIISCRKDLKLNDYFKIILGNLQEKYSLDLTDSHPSKEQALDKIVHIIKSKTKNCALVIEDFQNTAASEYEIFCQAIRTLYDKEIKVIIASASWESSFASSATLANRTTSINASNWSSNDLMRVVESGEKILNIRFQSKFKEELVAHCDGSILLLQECCLKMTEFFGGVTEAQSRTKEIKTNAAAVDIVRDYFSQKSTPTIRVLQNIGAGSVGKTTDARYAVVIEVILFASRIQRKLGISFHKISEEGFSISQKRKLGLSKSQIKDAAERIVSIQHEHINSSPYPALFGSVDNRLVVVDNLFLAWISSLNFAQLHEVTQNLYQ